MMVEIAKTIFTLLTGIWLMVSVCASSRYQAHSLRKCGLGSRLSRMHGLATNNFIMVTTILLVAFCAQHCIRNTQGTLSQTLKHLTPWDNKVCSLH